MENWTPLDDETLAMVLPLFPEALTNNEPVHDMPATQETPQSGPTKINKGFWTEEEHRKFLEGLEKCGEGSWMAISKRFVMTRTHTQIASHAQKYFKYQEDSKNENNNKKKRKRISIYATTHNTQSTHSESSQHHQFYQQAAPPNHLMLLADQSQYNPQNAGNHQYFGSGYPNNNQNLHLQNSWNDQALGFEDPNLSSRPQDQNCYLQDVPPDLPTLPLHQYTHFSKDCY